MIGNIIKISMLCLSFAMNSSASDLTPANKRIAYSRDEINIMNNGDLCPKKGSNRYLHHMILVDTTTPLRSSQVDLIRRTVLSETYLRSLMPWDRLTIMRLKDVTPASNTPLFSKCRPRSGDPTSQYAIDLHDWKTESVSDVKTIFDKFFLADIEKTINELANPTIVNTDPNTKISSSPILSQIKEISRLHDLGFTSTSGYEKRKLTIVSDLVQNSSRLPLYEECPQSERCPSWESFANNKKYKMWVKRVIPDFSNDVDVEIVYLNSNADPNINKGILEFWYEFFEQSGVTNITDLIESDRG